MNIVETKGLCHSFGQHQVLDHIDLQIPEGEIFGLLGPSGAGKTTLIKILTGQLKQTEGHAQLFSMDTQTLGDAEHLRIGTMMDNMGLYERLSVQDNLSFYAEIYGIPTGEIEEVLKSTHLLEARKTPVSKLSKGMKNRLSLGRALMNHCELLFLDEPTSGLDPMTTREIHQVLRSEREKGTTIFLTTHNMYEAQSLCDRTALLCGGKIIECGAPSEICRKYDHLNKLEILLRNGEQVVLPNGPEAALPIGQYLKENQIASIHSTEPDLQSVFVELTGKGLQ